MQPFDRPPLELVEPVVDRWVRQPSERVEQVLADPDRLPAGTPLDFGTGRGLLLDRPFARRAHRDGLVHWHAPGRLLLQGPVVRYARVDVEVIMWSDDLSEVTIRGRGRRVITWGERRERRYFVLAHRVATHLADALSTHEILAPRVA